MDIRIGSPASGANFYKRPRLIAQLLRALRRDNVAFLGPRRTGKTSCLLEIQANPDGFLPLLLNLENHDSVEAWLNDMVRALRDLLEKPTTQFSKFKDHAGGLLDRLSKISVPGIGSVDLATKTIEAPWRKSADELAALLEEANLPILFLLDEFPTFLNLVAKKKSAAEVEAVLNWFRAVRHRLKDRQVRFLVTGSIGLKGVVRKLKLAMSVNDFDTHEIPPLSAEEALDFLLTLAKDQQVLLEKIGGAHILCLLGANWPILLQLFIAEIQDAGLAEAPSMLQLDQLYQSRLVNGGRNQYCESMWDRLSLVFPVAGEIRPAHEILKATCRNENGLTREDFELIHARLIPDQTLRALAAEELDYVIETLKHDGYLIQEIAGEQRTRFASNILRDFWRRKTN